MAIKKTFSLFALICLLTLGFGTAPSSALAETSTDGITESTELVDALESIDVDEIETSEIIEETEPTELPEAEEDSELTERLKGRLLLEVEGKGEVYYVDPENGEKEYLSDGESAHSLLRRRALGVTNANLEKIPVGEVATDSSVCEEETLAKRLRGRILLQVESHGEAWYVYPENCRRYYVGTFDRAYKIMKDLSLGIKTELLAKIRDTDREQAKKRLRILTHVYAVRQDITLIEAHTAVVETLKDARTCVADALATAKERETNERLFEGLKIGIIRRCLETNSVPVATHEEKTEAQSKLREQRRERDHRSDDLVEVEVEIEEEHGVVEVEVEVETEHSAVEDDGNSTSSEQTEDNSTSDSSGSSSDDSLDDSSDHDSTDSSDDSSGSDSTDDSHGSGVEDASFHETDEAGYLVEFTA